MYKEQLFKAGSLEWLEARSKCVTATEVASLFGLNKHKSARALAKDKREPKSIWSPHIRRGRILEPAVSQALCEDMDWDTELYGGKKYVSFFQHPNTQLSATPDAKRFNKYGKIDAIIELKTANIDRMEDWDFSVPVHYALQVYCQMMCTGVQQSYIACLGAFEPFPLIVYEIFPNDRVSSLIEQNVGEWWKLFYKSIEYTVDKNLKKEMKELVLANQKRVY